MMQLLRYSLECLDRQHERDLLFIPGRRFASFRYKAEQRLRAKTAAARYRKFARFVLKRTRLRSQPRMPVDFLLYAGTSNENPPLAPLARVLADRGNSVCVLCPARRVVRGGPSPPRLAYERYSPRVIVAALVLICWRLRALARELRHESDPLLGRAFLPAFCRIYLYLPYFLDVLMKTRPRYVVVANDLNAHTRSLITAAGRLGIRTVYLQHAAVTRLFPPLDVDLAFLDGRESAAAYAEAARACGFSASTQVFLSGQKKPLDPGRDDSHTKVGLAVNRLDRFEDICALVHRLTTSGMDVLVRPHPGQHRSFRRRLEATFADHPAVEMSCPDTEPVGTFLGRCRLLLAGHSSIHLEAAVTGVASYFVDLSESSISDFYGFLQSGLVESLPESFWQEGPTALESFEALTPARVAAARRFSASLGTPWQGREAELVAATLERIERGNELDDLYRPLAPEVGFATLWTLETGDRDEADADGAAARDPVGHDTS